MKLSEDLHTINKSLASADSHVPQEITALTRPSSLQQKPVVKELEERGVKIVSVDLQGPQDDLVKVLTGFDVLISAIYFQALQDEIPLANAAKAAGVKRFVPCNFGTPAPRGVMLLRDTVSDTPQRFAHQFSLPRASVLALLKIEAYTLLLKIK